MSYRILAINPGSTSTKIAVYEDDQPILEKTLRHSPEELAPFPDIIDQYEFRKKIVIEALAEGNIAPETLSAVVG